MTETAASEFAKRHEEFRKELAAVLNKYSMENGSNTPDFLLADYLIGCLRGLDTAIRMRDNWYGYRQFIKVNITSEAGGSLKFGK